MTTSTQNYKLKKPAPEDFYNIQDHNDNMDVIDGVLKGIEDKAGDVDLSGLVLKEEFGVHLADETSHGIGNKSTLLTTNKSTIVGALNELFTNANNLKSDWAGVVGSPLVSTDTSAQLKNKTQTIKNTLASNLTTKGQISSGTETLTALVNKIGQINTGKRSATGSVQAVNGVVNVSGLSFTPSHVIGYGDYYNSSWFRFLAFISTVARRQGGSGTTTMLGSMSATHATTSNSYHNRQLNEGTGANQMTSDGFYIQITLLQTDYTMNWIAIE